MFGKKGVAGWFSFQRFTQSDEDKIKCCGIPSDVSQVFLFLFKFAPKILYEQQTIGNTVNLFSGCNQMNITGSELEN